MAVLTTLSAGAGLLGGLFGGLGQQAAVKERNKINRIRAKTQKAISEAQYEISNKQALMQWSWDLARTEQLRSVEAQTAVDVAERGALLIDSAIQNYEINQGALADRFETEEQLRATQIGMEFDYGQKKLNDDIARQTAQYMRSVQQRGLQSQIAVNQSERQVQQLQQSLLVDQQRDYLNYNVSKAAAVLQDSGAKARYSARQGSGATSKRLAMEAGQRLGRLAAELNIKSQDRSSRMAILNKSLTGELANQLGVFALQMQDDAEAMQYSLDRYGANSTLQRQQLKDLTIPTFDLAQRQYGRELKSLELQTTNAIKSARQPYRQKEYMDPMKPIAGLKPVTLMPIAEKAPSTMSIIGNSLLAGVQGAMSAYDPKTNTFM